MQSSSPDLLKELAQINRWEYLPFCPICGSAFDSPSDLLRLFCQHYVCINCVEHIKTGPEGQIICPFDGKASEGFCDGEELAGELQFVKSWFKEAERSDSLHRQDVAKHLLEAIDILRRHLNMQHVPCRVIISHGTCSGRVGCPYDHSLQFYRKRPCPVPDCPNEECMFSHEGPHPRRSHTTTAKSVVSPAAKKVKTLPPPKPEKNKKKKITDCALL